MHTLVRGLSAYEIAYADGPGAGTLRVFAHLIAIVALCRDD